MFLQLCYAGSWLCFLMPLCLARWDVEMPRLKGRVARAVLWHFNVHLKCLGLGILWCHTLSCRPAHCNNLKHIKDSKVSLKACLLHICCFSLPTPWSLAHDLECAKKKQHGSMLNVLQQGSKEQHQTCWQNTCYGCWADKFSRSFPQVFYL